MLKSRNSACFSAGTKLSGLVRKKIITSTQKAMPTLRKYWKPEAQLRSIVYIDAGAAGGAVDAHAA